MLSITKSLPFHVAFSVYESEEGGAYADLSELVLKCQIRETVATDQEYPLVIDVDVTTKEYGFDLDLSAEETDTIPWGSYLIDVVSTTGEIILPKEAIKVVGHVTLPVDPDDVPNFVTIFETALND